MDALAKDVLHLPDSYNSDDEEFSDGERTVHKQGFANCQELFKNALENLRHSKKTLQNHQPERVSPGTNDQMRRWLNLFRAFLKTLNLPEDATPTGEHIYRFIDTISRTIKTRYRGKQVPSLDTIKGGLKHLSATLSEIYEDFTISTQKSIQRDSLLNKLVKDGILHKALASRSGDISRTRLSTGIEFLAFKDITLRFTSAHQIDSMTMDVELRFVKGFKDKNNDNRNVRLDALGDAANDSLCPVKLLVIHALRIGAVKSKSWDQLMADTLGREDKTVQWITPDRPVILAIVPGRCAFLDPLKPAVTSQLLKTVHDMGTRAGLLVKVTTRDLRNGSAADISHLKEGPRGFATMATASAVGHRMTSFINGVTERYSGGSNVSIWSLRAESTWADTRAPTFATTPFIPPVVKKHELEAYCKAQDWDSTSSICMERARRDIRRAEEDKWRDERKASGHHAPFTATAAFDKSSVPLGTWSNSDINSQGKISDVTKFPERIVNIDPQLLALSSGSSNKSPFPHESTVVSITATGLDSLTLLDNDLDDLSDETLNEQQAAEADLLADIICARERIASDATLQNDDSETVLEDLLLDSLEQGPRFDANDAIHIPFVKFIEFFSRINVIKNKSVSSLSKAVFDERVQDFVAIGNSRDFPSAFRYACVNREWGCQVTTSTVSKLKNHINICKISETFPLQNAVFQCRKGCDKVFRSSGSRNSHEKDHDFIRRQCHIGCTDGKWFETLGAWKSHKAHSHDSEWDRETTCSVPGCPRTTPFPTRSSYLIHLRDTHKLKGNDVSQHVIPKTHRGPVFGKRPCPYEDCKKSQPGEEFSQRSKLERHLESKKHRLTVEEANEKIDNMIAGI